MIFAWTDGDLRPAERRSCGNLRPPVRGRDVRSDPARSGW